MEEIRHDIEEINAGAAALCENLSEEELGWRPQPGRWSVAEHLAHLETTTHTFLPTVDAALERARRENLIGKGPFRLSLLDRFYIWYVQPPVRIRLPTPPPLHPQQSGPATEALPHFLDAQRLMVQRLDQAEGFDLARVRITSPLAKFVRMSLLAFFHVFTGHERRHLWHIRNLRQQMAARPR